MFLTSCWGSVSNCCLLQLFSYITTRTSWFSMRWRWGPNTLSCCFFYNIYIYLKNDIGVHIFLLIELYVLKTSHCGWNPEQNSTYNSPRIINVRVIDRHYLILTINKRLFTLKVENHNTAKLGNQHENLLKREIQRM